MIVLVDTSVWIEFFRRRPSVDIAPLELLIEERRVATCLPIRTEVLSGQMDSKTKNVIEGALDAMISVDPDWNAKSIWDQIAGLAVLARKKIRKLPGIVDRAILLAARESGCQIWSLDRRLMQLAEIMEIPEYEP